MLFTMYVHVVSNVVRLVVAIPIVFIYIADIFRSFLCAGCRCATKYINYMRSCAFIVWREKNTPKCDDPNEWGEPNWIVSMVRLVLVRARHSHKTKRVKLENMEKNKTKIGQIKIRSACAFQIKYTFYILFIHSLETFVEILHICMIVVSYSSVSRSPSLWLHLFSIWLRHVTMYLCMLYRIALLS